jgi:tripartite-type tricarboxylate transporter receptor subunit TctC
MMKNVGCVRYLLAFTQAIVLLASTGIPTASAQNYPNNMVKLIVPFVAGGGVDTIARVMQPLLSEALGQTVIIENRGGAGGGIGAAAVAKAAPDGYTLLLGTGGTHGTNPAVSPTLSYHPVNDFVPVALVISSPFLLVTNAQVPATTAADLIKLAQANPGKLNFGSYGNGSSNHLAAELFNSMAKIQASHIPYRGSSPAQIDLVANRIQYMFSSGSALLSYFEDKSMKLLGVAGDERWSVVPSAPTISESGLPGYEVSVWYGVFAPAGTPKAVVDLLNAKINAVLASPRVKERFLKFGIQAQGGAPEVLAKRVAADVRKWTDLAREKNIRIGQ